MPSTTDQAKQRMATTLRSVLRDEDGAAYTLSYVMVIPVFLLLICVIVETTLFMTAKIGTVYAAYAGARTASVWSSAADWSVAQQKAEAAALNAFTPFARGVGNDPAGGGSSDFEEAYESYVSDPASAKYILAKRASAEDSLQVEIEGPPTSWDAPIEVRINFDYEFGIPGVGRILGEANGNGDYRYTISTTATLPNEAPQNDQQQLGIGYGQLR